MGHGALSMGAWSMGHGAGGMEHGAWCCLVEMHGVRLTTNRTGERATWRPGENKKM